MEAGAIGIANTALNSVVKTILTTITNEIGLLLGVQEELFFIKEELEMMEGFLKVAKTENVKDVLVSIWVKQVQELAFDVEDCLHEASVHLVKKTCLPVMCSVKKRDDIAKQIRMLKTRIEDVSRRNLRYELIKKGNGGPTYDESASTRSIANVEALLVGLDEPKKKLVELIQKEHGEVISVVGMGGLGKTTLVREVYGCQEVRDEFKCLAWVTIQHPFNMEEFIETLAKQISINPDDNKSELLSKKTTKEKVTDHYLKGNKYLTVLDDLSSVSEWDKIKDVLPMVNGSRIIVTTRLRPLAESISHPLDNIYDIKELSEINAFKLFFKAVYKTPNYRLVIDHSKTNDDPPQESSCNMKNGTSSTEIIEDVSEVQKECITITITEDMKTEAGLIINSCGRLPLAIVTIGSYLSTKSKESVVWNTMNAQLSSQLANNPDLGILKPVLTSSYDGMPYHLKPSLLYLSVFHNHKEIRRSRIIRRWMADGYVMEGRKRTAEEVGKDYFYDLMGRSLILPSQMNTFVNGDVKRCNIHDIMYELILGKAVDENIVSLLEDENLITMTDKVRHLVITGEPCNGDKVLERVKLSHMRSLSIFGGVGDYLSYPRMKLIRVLDLEGNLNLNDGDLRSIGKLRHLKYLGLRGTTITKLPNSLGKLSELETLDIRNTGILLLPAGVSKLHKLSYLRAGPKYSLEQPTEIGIGEFMFYVPAVIFIGLWYYICGSIPLLPFRFCVKENKDRNYKGLRVPHGIGKLKSLTTCGIIDIDGSTSLAKEMQNLTNLRKLGVRGFTEENGKTLAKVIDGLKHLKSLELRAEDDSGLGCWLESVSSPPKYLQSLKLYGRLDKLPDWISSLENLEKIHLERTWVMGAIKAIEKLPNLKILYMLCQSFGVSEEELCFGEGTFPMLQVMTLEHLSWVRLVSIEKTALKRLEQLKMKNCWCNPEVSGLDCLEQLKELELLVNFRNENEKMFASNLQEKLSVHPKKPVLRVINR